MTIKLLPEIAALFILTFARLGTMMMLMPGIGEAGIPARLRLALALVVTVLFYPIAAPLYPTGLLKNLPMLGFYLFGEIGVGIFVGLSARLVMAATQVAGTIIATQLGLGFVTSVDPTQGQQGVIFGNFLSVLALTMIFVTDLHYLAISALTSSFTLFKPGVWMPVGDFAEVAIKLVAESFKIGVQMSAPFLCFGLVFYLGLGVLSKLMPQFQIFFVAMPANIVIGLILFSVLIGTLMLWYLDHVRDGLGRLVVG